LPQPSSIVHVEFQSAHGVSYTLQPKEVPAMANVSIPLLAMVQPVAAFNSACLDRIGQTMRPIVGRIDRPLGAKAFVRQQLATSCHVLPCPAMPSCLVTGSRMRSVGQNPIHDWVSPQQTSNGTNGTGQPSPWLPTL